MGLVGNRTIFLCGVSMRMPHLRAESSLNAVGANAKQDLPCTELCVCAQESAHSLFKEQLL